MSTDHILLCGPSNFALCQCCGSRYHFKFPLPIPDMVKRIDAFVLLHADCKAPDEQLKIDILAHKINER